MNLMTSAQPQLRDQQRKRRPDRLATELLDQFLNKGDSTSLTLQPNFLSVIRQEGH